VSEPDEPAAPAHVFEVAPFAGRILLSGSVLMAASAEDLAATNFGEQRWKVRRTVADFDRSYASERRTEPVSYRAIAPAFATRYPAIADHLERLARFRLELYDALVPAGESPDARRAREDGVRRVAVRYRIPVGGIGAR
jgi:hypothetical protein